MITAGVVLLTAAGPVLAILLALLLVAAGLDMLISGATGHEASAPAGRVRLNAIAASTSQAESRRTCPMRTRPPRSTGLMFTAPQVGGRA